MRFHTILRKVHECGSIHWAASLGNRCNVEGVLGIGAGEVVVHDGPLVIGRQWRDHQDRISERVEVEGDCLPKIAACFDCKQDSVLVAGGETFFYVLPKSQSIAVAARGEGERFADVDTDRVDDRRLVVSFGRIDTDDELAGSDLLLVLRAGLVHRTSVKGIGCACGAHGNIERKRR
jgi:hypothetical protein